MRPLSRLLLTLLLGAVFVGGPARGDTGAPAADHSTEAIIAPPPPTDRAVHPVTVAAGDDANLVAPDWPSVWANWDYSPDGGTTWIRVENDYFFSLAHGSTLHIQHTPPVMDGYLFRVYLDGSVGIFQSDPGRLTVAAPAGTSQLVNLSARAWVGDGANALFAGFVVAGNGAKGLLLRGVGPTLSEFGVNGVLQNPRLTLYDSASRPLDSNARWTDLPVPVVQKVAASVGAFALPMTSTDASLIWGVAAGPYTIQVNSNSGESGVALAEIYDSETWTSTRLVNLSARAYVGTGGNILIAGLVVGGSGQKTLLIRGLGPALAKLGVPGPLSRTTLGVYDSTGRLVASNSGWGSSPIYAAAFARVGAFALDANSADSALIVTVPAGAYTVQLSGDSGATGVGLIEVYEMQ